MFTWGSSALGQLGRVESCASPYLLMLPSPASLVAAGSHHTLIQLTDGTLMGCGSNDHAQLGFPSVKFKMLSIPTRISFDACTLSSLISKGELTVEKALSTMRKAAAGAASYPGFADMQGGLNWSCALSQEGNVFVWGTTEYNLMGYTPKSDVIEMDTPQTISALASASPVVRIAVSGSNALALTTKGTVYSWGRCLCADVSSTCKLVPGLEDIAAIGCGPHSFFASTSKGVLFTWGQASIEGSKSAPGLNQNGKFRIGHDKDHTEPTLYNNPSSRQLMNAFAFAGGLYHSYLLVGTLPPHRPKKPGGSGGLVEAAEEQSNVAVPLPLSFFPLDRPQSVRLVLYFVFFALIIAVFIFTGR